MSVSASITIKLDKKVNQTISAKELINTLLLDKWKLKDKGKISYLPLGDDDTFDWQYDETSIDKLFDIIDKKEALGEIIGLLMLWESTEIGVHLLIHSELELSFSLDVNRKIISYLDNKSLTDIDWYMARTIRLLEKYNYLIESFSFDEY